MINHNAPLKEPRIKFNFIKKVKAWAINNPKRSRIVFGAILIAIVIAMGATIYALTHQPAETTVQPVGKPKPKKIAPVVYHSPLTGIKVADEATTKLPVTGIMIENSPDARPQSGLKQAGIIYEAIAEGGITRFLALYQEAKPELIGPVRSLRMYYLDWAAPYQASIVHFGGSAASLTEVSNGKYRNLDLMRDGAKYYWRATDRYAPHNVYTDFGKLDALNSAKDYTTSQFTSWPRQDGKASETPSANSIDIKVSGPLFNSHYDYNAETNTYTRSINGQPSNDREGGQFTPNTVIAMRVDMSKVLQDGYREDIQTNGSGEAFVFQNGVAETVSWRKNSRDEPLHFFDQNGSEVKLNRGQTWVVAVPNGSGAISW